MKTGGARLEAVWGRLLSVPVALWNVASGRTNMKWTRVVMNEATRGLVESLRPERLRALEISGFHWVDVGFKSYTRTSFPEYDVCAGPLPHKYDIILADQVLEHVLWPYRAGRNIHEMLEPGGYFLVSVPFLIRVHNSPTDCTRWTEVGLKHFLAECGFPLEAIRTDSWGNRDCVIESFKMTATPYRKRIHSLRNEPDFPIHVWALAQKRGQLQATEHTPTGVEAGQGNGLGDGRLAST